jgi:hypothetical protein
MKGNGNGQKRATNGAAAIQREILPIPDQKHVGLTTFDAKDPNTKYPPIEPLRPPPGAPNVLIVLLDDVGFGASSAFGGPCHMPTAERLAAGGLKFSRFHTTALCSPTRQALFVESTAPIPTGQHQLRMEFEYDGGGVGKGGNVTLFIDGNPVGQGRVDRTIPMAYSADEACDVGRDTGSPSSPDYGPRDNAFTGNIAWVQLDLGDDDQDHLISPEERLRVAMAHQ